MNSRVVLKARPEGLVTPDAMEIEEVPISVLQPGQCLVKTISLGVDAFIRTMMDAEARRPPSPCTMPSGSPLNKFTHP